CGPRCSAWKPARRTTSSTWAATRCWRRRWPAAWRASPDTASGRCRWRPRPWPTSPPNRHCRRCPVRRRRPCRRPLRCRPPPPPSAAQVVRGERALYFGDAPRRLFGMHHARADARAGRPLLVPAPLLQEGVVCQRALWTVCDALAASGGQALRFDWYGSGESAGDSAELTLEGMASDLARAQAFIGGDPRILALRSASLPVLHAALARGQAVDLVLWDPCLSGARLLARWRGQHRVQLTAAGRYLREGRAPVAADELLGFDLSPGLPAALEALDFRQ